MSTPNTPFIIRRAPRNGVKVRHYLADDLVVSRIDETRATGRSLGGLFREVENTGRKIKGVLRIQTKRDLCTDGHGRPASHSDHVKLNVIDLKKVVRRARPQEMTEIAQVDADIEVVEQELKELRAKRAALAATAWTKAHAVSIKELEEMADAPRPSSMPLTEEQKTDLAAVHDEIRGLFSK